MVLPCSLLITFHAMSLFKRGCQINRPMKYFKIRKHISVAKKWFRKVYKHPFLKKMLLPLIKFVISCICQEMISDILHKW